MKLLSVVVRQVISDAEVHETITVEEFTARVDALRGYATDPGAVLVFLYHHILKGNLVGLASHDGSLGQVIKTPVAPSE